MKTPKQVLGSVFSKLAINIADLRRMAGYTTLLPDPSRLARRLRL